MNIKKKIDKDTTLEEVLKYKGSEKVLGKYNVPCLTCPFAKMEMGVLKIGDICRNYNISLDGLVNDLNELFK